jgi:hypothetical protein
MAKFSLWSRKPMTNNPKHQRLQELFALSRQRYLDEGGRPTGHADGNVYMTPDEKQEFLAIARSLRQKPSITGSHQETHAQSG